MNCNIIIRHSDNSLCSYYLCLAVKIKFIIILLIVLTLNEIHVIRNFKKKANEQSLYCKMCAKISLH